MKKLYPLLSVLFLIYWGCEEEVDTTPPDISIASPVDGAIVSDTITIKTVVADNDGINNVEFYLDGDLLATVSEEPFQTEWNTSESSNGEHTLQCKAVDNSDNETLSESIQVTVANALFTANFTNDWLCADCGEGIIFISDMDGNVLAEATWTGNASFEIEAPEDLTEFPERVSVTTVRQGGLTTNLDIPVGSSWTWGDYYLSPDYDNPINVEFGFQNIPDHAGYVLSSLWSSYVSNSGIIYRPYSFDFYESPMDIYLKLNTADSGPKYLWINDITGGYYQINLSNMSETESQTIDLQGNSVGFRKYLYGYPTPGSRNTGRYRLDYGYDYDSTVAEIKVYYPLSTFSDYRTSLYFYDSDNTNDYWYQSVYGDIPNTFDKIDADFDFISTTPTNFQISTTSSNFDQISSWWTQSGDNYYSWYFYGPNDLTSYSLPNLPNSVLNKYSDIEMQLFELSYTDLIDYSELDSFENILDILFNSSDYFYNVVNDFRSRLKYYDSGRSTNLLQDYEMEDEYFEMQQHR
ncbi:MAG: Ig-like domain-containing protein [Candidatus Marinimicrobia bacterium]|nr:Ig-like domain-containing protein [Candidatus Neomarinimicrobiota bacterium]